MKNRLNTLRRPEQESGFPPAVMRQVSSGQEATVSKGRRDVHRVRRPTYEALERRVEELEKVIAEAHRDPAGLAPMGNAYRYLVENANDAIIVLQEKRLRFHNRKTEALLGYSREMLKEKPLRDHLHPEDRGSVTRRFRRLLEGEGLSDACTLRLMNSRGEPLWVTVSAVAITWEGSPAVLCFVRDITRQKRLETELLQAQKMEAIGTLAGGIAHDFNNLLTTIIGNAELALMKLTQDDPLAELILEGKRAALRAASLTGQLLAFSRKQMIRPEVLDLNRRVQGMEKMLTRLIGEDIALHTNLDPSLQKTHADPGQIDQIIMNLSVNARDAMAQGGKLLIGTANVELRDADFRRQGIKPAPGPYVLLTVADTGIGMDEHTRSHIFEPFFTTKEPGKGTGLGLATVYGIVKQSKGFVWVQSAPGTGTVFKIYFPGIDVRAGTEEGAPRPGRELGGSETILIVEDDDMVRRVACHVLGGYGYRVIEARDGRTALGLGESHQGPIHLMLTDVVMPGMNGRELAERIRSSRPRMRVLYMSGYTDHAIVTNQVLDPRLPFVQKPFTPEGLVQVIRQVLDA